MSYTHLSTFERGRIDGLKNLGYSARKIAKELGRSNSTISRELKRLEGNYVGEKAQINYEIKRKKSLPKGKYNNQIAKEIKFHLNLTRSPEQISNTVLKNKISFKTIYRWIDKGLIENCSRKNLRHKGKRKKSDDKRGQFSKGKSIHERAQEVESRKVFGHWELDTVLSSRGENKECFATFIERKTRFYIVVKMKDRTANSMEESIKYICSIYPKKIFKSFTVDRGKEFACYKKIEEELNIPVFFADPHAPWQRGSNENSNGLLREFFPKKTDLSKVTNKNILDSMKLINTRPRKCLYWHSASYEFLHEILKCCS